MAIAITIPRLGWNMEEGVFAGWLKRDGDAVREGEPLFSLEGDKATQDVESIDPGILRIPPEAPEVGARVRVGAIIGYLVESDVASLPAQSMADRELSNPTKPSRIISTPLARRVARDLGIDWTKLVGSGVGGRIRKVDILSAARSTRPDPETRLKRSTPIGPTRRTIAERMVSSHQTTAPVTLTTTVDATNLVGLRKQYKVAALSGRGLPSITDLFVKLSALTLCDHTLLNSRWADDRIEICESVNIGIAVDTEAGLLVPVIRDASRLTLGQIAERSSDLIRRAREGRISLDCLKEGTFTITNLGSFGIEAFTPILNPPECAILGLGRISRLPVMIGDQVVGRDRMTLSLTFDHRIVDGAPAARFLQQLGQKIENPGPWLIG
jgi:pyruvate dehydrogenase E2 component (dihydrolipoamide acetyltransferase)